MENRKDNAILKTPQIRQTKAYTFPNASATAIELRSFASAVEGLNLDPGLWSLCATKIPNDGFGELDLSKAICGTCIFKGLQDDGSGVNNLTVCRRLPPSPECIENAGDNGGLFGLINNDATNWTLAGAGGSFTIVAGVGRVTSGTTAGIRLGPLPSGRYRLTGRYRTDGNATFTVRLANSGNTAFSTAALTGAAAVWTAFDIRLYVSGQGQPALTYLNFAQLVSGAFWFEFDTLELEYIYDSRARWNQINSSDWCGEWRRATVQALSRGDDRVWFRLSDDRSVETNWTTPGGIVLPGPPGEPILWERPRFLEVEGRPALWAVIPPWTRFNVDLVGPCGRG